MRNSPRSSGFAGNFAAGVDGFKNSFGLLRLIMWWVSDRRALIVLYSIAVPWKPCRVRAEVWMARPSMRRTCRPLLPRTVWGAPIAVRNA